MQVALSGGDGGQDFRIKGGRFVRYESLAFLVVVVLAIAVVGRCVCAIVTTFSAATTATAATATALALGIELIAFRRGFAGQIGVGDGVLGQGLLGKRLRGLGCRSEEHTSELQSLMRI